MSRLATLLLYSLVGLTRVLSQSLRAPLVYRVTEETPAPQVLGNIVRDSDLGESFTAADLRLISFGLIRKDPYDRYFDIAENGTVFTTEVIDREVLCPAQAQCVILMDVEVKPIEYFQIIKLEVAVLDVNDNSPQFEDSVMHISLPESTPLGSLVPLAVAWDLDSPEHGIASYRLEMLPAHGRNPAPGIFTLETDGDLQDLLGEIYIKVEGSLDHEDQSRYLLRIVASDSATPTPNRAFLMVNITVTDINDNTPQFTQPKYDIEVPEDVSNGSLILTVTAFDFDSGDRGRVYYSFSQRTMDLYRDRFYLDRSNGNIYLKKPLDYETDQQYTLVVMATDMSASSLTGEALVSITVTDINDNLPAITITPLRGNSSTITILENSLYNMPLAHISVLDPDSGSSGMVQCRLNDSRFLLNQMYESDFMLQASVALDHENVSSLELLLTCTDQGVPALSSTQLIHVEVQDENDNPPRFDQYIHTVTLDHDLLKGERLIQIQATDPDSRENGQLSYHLPGAMAQRLFQVDPASGAISARVDVPLHALRDLTVELVAADGGNPSLSRSTAISVTSTLGEDCDADNVTVLTVEENNREGVAIGQLNSTTHKSSTCFDNYVILTETVQDIFSIDTQTGLITVNRILDHETTSCYVFSTALVRLCHSAADESVLFDEITVHVKDTNDNAPVITYPNDVNDTVRVYPGTTHGHIITRVRAYDGDSQNNARLDFSIQNPQEYHFLDLDSATGVLSLVQDLPDTLSSIPLVIQVSDHGVPALTSTAQLWVVRNSSLQTSAARQPMLTSDSLVKVLAIAVPCGFVIVVLLVVMVVLIKRSVTTKRTPVVIPTIDLKVQDAEFLDNQVNDDKSRLPYPADDLTKSRMPYPADPPKSRVSYPADDFQKSRLPYPAADLAQVHHEQQDSGYDGGDHHQGAAGISREKLAKLQLHGGDSNIPPSIPYVGAVHPIPAAASCQDSDSGCSADMSNSLPDSSWGGGKWPSYRLQDNQPHPQAPARQSYINPETVKRFGFANNAYVKDEHQIQTLKDRSRDVSRSSTRHSLGSRSTEDMAPKVHHFQDINQIPRSSSYCQGVSRVSSPTTGHSSAQHQVGRAQSYTEQGHDKIPHSGPHSLDSRPPPGPPPPRKQKKVVYEAHV